MSLTKCLILIVTPLEGTTKTLCLFLFGGAILASSDSISSLLDAFLLDVFDAALKREDMVRKG